MLARADIGASPSPAGEQTARPEEVATLFTSLVLALRSLQLYGPSNLTTQRALEHVRAGFVRAWEHAAELEVEIRASDIVYERRVVYSNPNHAESLAFLLFRDGLRTLRFHPGFERDELPAFLEVLHRVRYQPTESDDLITLLWDQDFLHLRHGYIDAVSTSEEAAEVEAGVEAAVAATQLGPYVLPQAEPMAPSLPASGYDDAAYPGSADPPALPEAQAVLQPHSLMLDPETLVYLQRELEEEMRRDLRQDVVNALLDSLEDPDRRAQSEIIGILGDLVPQLVGGRHFRSAAECLSELRAFQEQPDVLDEVRLREVEVLFEDLAVSDAVQELMRALESGDLQSDLDSIRTLVSHLGPALLPRLLRAREKAGGKDLRAALGTAAEQLARRHPEAVVAALQSEDPLIVRAALRILVGLGRNDALAETARLLRHADTRVRLGAVEVIVALAGEKGLEPLCRALDDTAREVRVAALWGLATWRHQAVLPRLEGLLDSKAFRDTDSDEKMALLDAYARIGGARAVDRLGRLLHARTLLRPKEPSEVRAYAARALALTGTPVAKAMLERAQDDRDVEVRRAVQRSLRKAGGAP
jgi:hypothetical protein